MRYVEKNCPVCGNKFVVDERVADGELFCTLGCRSRGMSGEAEGITLEV